MVGVLGLMSVAALVACSGAPDASDGNAVKADAGSKARGAPKSDDKGAPSDDDGDEDDGQPPLPPPTPKDAGAKDADAATTPPACEAGATVYAFSNGDRWQYSTTDQTPSGWTRRGPVFRLAKDGTTQPTHELYLLYSAQADDYLVTSNKTEGATLGYALRTTLGRAYDAGDGGGTRLWRFVKPSPLRHYVTTNVSTGPAGFTKEPESTPTGFVCARE
jgi:hypothetical protein